MNIGITGHQYFKDSTTQKWVSEQMEGILSENEVTHGGTCLAVGTDQMFAQQLVLREISYTAYIPCRKYLETFKTKPDLTRYRNYLDKAKFHIELPFEQPIEEAFFEASKRLVEDSDIILGVWDGSPAKGFGGTADVLNYAKSLDKKIIHIHTEKREVLVLNLPD